MQMNKKEQTIKLNISELFLMLGTFLLIIVGGYFLWGNKIYAMYYYLVFGLFLIILSIIASKDRKKTIKNIIKGVFELICGWGRMGAIFLLILIWTIITPVLSAKINNHSFIVIQLTFFATLIWFSKLYIQNRLEDVKGGKENGKVQRKIKSKT